MKTMPQKGMLAVEAASVTKMYVKHISLTHS